MPDHADWPPGVRRVEQLLRLSGYVLIAVAGFVVPNHQLGGLVCATAGAAAASVAVRWWHAEFVLVPVLAWALFGVAVLAQSPVVSAFSMALALIVSRRGVDLLMFSMQTRAARRARVEAWRKVAAELDDEAES